ncbi:flagellar basal-body rod protein FlgG [Serpentinicella sp. ANB-PHB4]|uniref:flagellar basal-body rod protein FlgG n=1 Tax=Serpentinicella sp. ANB-PHB4 TaxID=3074076 RepID=UPI002861E2FF|nr:flagellar basal-body rod protein FlgG [Serpentinicella sp. ANB-PHB4]MDR5659701.1 flagellar basal-body rod protein FlgG [Serpentinicella sp. ANB-PHB4]
MRALWTAASGMKSQQLNIDTVSNNLANVNTTAYKKQRVEFKDLLYANLRRNNGELEAERPVNLQVGHGVMPGSTARFFTNGGLESTENPLDLAIDGEGFFVVQGNAGEQLYTRDGSFKLSVQDGVSTIVTSDGYPLLNNENTPIVLEPGMENFTVSELGVITVENEAGEILELGTVELVNFINPAGLEATGRNLYRETAASGELIPMEEERDTNIRQGFLETSNVQMVDEMVRMITAQRAYEISSKTIQTADEMLGMANNLRR